MCVAPAAQEKGHFHCSRRSPDLFLTEIGCIWLKVTKIVAVECFLARKHYLEKDHIGLRGGQGVDILTKILYLDEGGALYLNLFREIERKVT